MWDAPIKTRTVDALSLNLGHTVFLRDPESGYIPTDVAHKITEIVYEPKYRLVKLKVETGTVAEYAFWLGADAKVEVEA